VTRSEVAGWACLAAVLVVPSVAILIADLVSWLRGRT